MKQDTVRVHVMFVPLRLF